MKVIEHPARRDNEMGADDFQALVRSRSGKPDKSVKSHKKPQPSTLTAEQFRDNYVDQEESPLQQRCVEWFELQYPQLFLYAIANGGQRSKAEAAIMVGEGVKRGMTDLGLAQPSGEFHGLYIEMKTMKKGSKLSDDQIIIHARLRAAGYDVAVPRTFEEFQTAINDYLKP